MFLTIRLFREEPAESSAWNDASDNEYYRFTHGADKIELKKRQAYPTTYAHMNGRILVFGYGQALEDTDVVPTDCEFLQCALALDTREVFFQRDAFCTLRLFFSASDNFVVCSDDLPTVVSYRSDQAGPLMLDSRALVSELFLFGWQEHTYFKDVSLFGERMRLEWRPGKYKTSRAVGTPVPLQGDCKDFKQNLEKTLEKYWAMCRPDEAGFEVSGGIDSATMPLFIAKRSHSKPLTGALCFQGNFGQTQIEKLAALSGAIGQETFFTPLDGQNDFPLARMFKPEYAPVTFYQYQEIYTEVLDRLALEFQNRGTTVVFTGIGGDELFENNTPSTLEKSFARSRRIAETSPYLTAKAKQLFYEDGGPQEKVPSQPLAESAYIAAQSRNNVYIARGIWPLSPLSDPALFSFCQSLHVAFRSNKNILRAYHQANKFPEAIYHPAQNEHFGDFFTKSVYGNYHAVLSEVLENSRLQEWGFIDASKLRERFDTLCRAADESKELFDIFRILSAEIILQSQPGLVPDR